MSYETLLYDVDGPIATITLNRPERLNTIVPPMPDEFERAIIEATRDAEIKVIVVQGAGLRRLLLRAGRGTPRSAQHHFGAASVVAASTHAMRARLTSCFFVEHGEFRGMDIPICARRKVNIATGSSGGCLVKTAGRYDEGTSVFRLPRNGGSTNRTETTTPILRRR